MDESGTHVLDGGGHPDEPVPATVDSGGGRSQLARRKRALALITGATVLLGVGGLVGATFVKSPAQLAAERRPAPPTVLTAPVKRQIVGATVVMRGTVAGSRQVTATPIPVGTGGSGGGSGTGAALLTAIRKSEGDTVNAGEVIVEVSGRPLVALAGTEPAYRDLKPGDSGKDVTALRQALGQLGFATSSDPAGRFGAATKRAVRAYYERLGFAVPTAGDGDVELLAAQDAVTQARRRLRDATEAAVAGQPGHAVEDARQDLRTAEQRLADLDARSGPMVPQAEVVFLPTFPARVTKIGGAVGQPVQAPLVTLSSGELQVTGRLDPADRGIVQAGAVVDIDSEVTGFHGTGKVTAVAEQARPAAGGADGQPGQDKGPAGPAYVAVTVTPDAPLDPGLTGQDVRLTAKFAQTAEPVLAVPSAAITSSADGRTHVVVVDPSGEQHTVEVRTGKSGAGFVEVTPVSAELTEGDRVVIGR